MLGATVQLKSWPMAFLTTRVQTVRRAYRRRARSMQASKACGLALSKDEAGGRARVQRGRCCVDDGVGQTAGAAHHGQGAVTQAVDLIQAAGLEARRHQEDVGAGLDAVREVLVVTDVQTQLLSVSCLRERAVQFRDAHVRCRA